MVIETAETVAARIRRALPYVGADRIIVAPDCGMKYLPRLIAENVQTPQGPLEVGHVAGITDDGVVFALSTGASGSAAVLHAYDGSSGKALWNSGAAMTTSASPGSYWSALSQVYVGTDDGNVYAFGFVDERR